MNKILILILFLFYPFIANAEQIKNLETCKNYVDKEIEYRYDLAELQIQEHCAKRLNIQSPVDLLTNPNALLNLFLEASLEEKGLGCVSTNKTKITKRLERLRLIDHHHCHRIFQKE